MVLSIILLNCKKLNNNFAKPLNGDWVLHKDRLFQGKSTCIFVFKEVEAFLIIVFFSEAEK